MAAIILSIKPEFVEKIISGEKKFEYRRRLCKREIDRIYIYSTAPVKQVVAEATVTGRMEGDKEDIWRWTEKFSGIDRKYFDCYFESRECAGCYCLGAVKVYETGFDLQKFGILHAPQSYVYVVPGGAVQSLQDREQEFSNIPNGSLRE